MKACGEDIYNLRVKGVQTVNDILIVQPADETVLDYTFDSQIFTFDFLQDKFDLMSHVEPIMKNYVTSAIRGENLKYTKLVHQMP